MSARPVAAIDCGTNSIRLLIARLDDDGRVVDLERHMEIVRLGYGVDRTGRFDPAAIDRALDACRRYARLIEHHGAEELRFAATSATRDAANRDEFTGAVRDILGVSPEVIAGEEEAELSFRGAVETLPDLPGSERLVVDIGGGSTELVRGADGPRDRISLDMGSVRITERHLHADPPTPTQIDAAIRDIDALLDQASPILTAPGLDALVGVAGTVTTLTALQLGIETYSPDVTHGARLPIAQALQYCDRLVRMPRCERSALRAIHPGRVDVIGAGALIWARILQRVAESSPLDAAVTSEHDILDGIALSILDRQRDVSGTGRPA